MHYFHKQTFNAITAVQDVICKLNSLCRVIARKMCLFIDGQRGRCNRSLNNLCFCSWQVCWFGNKGGLALFFALPLFILLMINSGLFANTVYNIWQAQRQGMQYIHKKRKNEVVQTSLLDSTDSTARGNSRTEGSSVSGR